MVHLESYRGILGQFLMPQLQQENINPCFPVRWSVATLFVRNLCLPEKYIHCFGPIAVPSCSPNLMPPDFTVWNALRTVLIFSSPRVLLT